MLVTSCFIMFMYKTYTYLMFTDSALHTSARSSSSRVKLLLTHTIILIYHLNSSTINANPVFITNSQGVAYQMCPEPHTSHKSRILPNWVQKKIRWKYNALNKKLPKNTNNKECKHSRIVQTNIIKNSLLVNMVSIITNVEYSRILHMHVIKNPHHYGFTFQKLFPRDGIISAAGSTY